MERRRSLASSVFPVSFKTLSFFSFFFRKISRIREFPLNLCFLNFLFYLKVFKTNLLNSFGRVFRCFDERFSHFKSSAFAKQIPTFALQMPAHRVNREGKRTRQKDAEKKVLKGNGIRGIPTNRIRPNPFRSFLFSKNRFFFSFFPKFFSANSFSNSLVERFYANSFCVE